MAFKNKDNFYLTKAGKTSLAAFVLLLIILNVLKFVQLVAVNPQKIVEYHAPTDDFAEFRHFSPMILYSSVPDAKVKLVIVPTQKFLQYQDVVRRILSKRINPLTRVIIEGTTYCPLLQDIFDEVQCVDETGSQDLKTFLKADSTAVILFRNISDEADSVPFLSLVKELNLRPKVLNLFNGRKLKEQTQTGDSKDKKEQETNLQNFAADYRKALRQILTYPDVSFEKNEQNRHLFDRAAVVVLACVPETAECEEYANEPFSESVYAALKKEMKKARKDWPQREIKVFLLTDMFEQGFSSEAEFSTNLRRGDGVLLREGLRSGIVLPYFWQFYPKKKEFIKQLKIKSGLNPDYWSDNLHIYYFRAVEIVE